MVVESYLRYDTTEEFHGEWLKRVPRVCKFLVVPL